MKKRLIGLLVIFVLSCASNEVSRNTSNEVKKEGGTINVSSEIDKAIISASETIVNSLPTNSIVALFNISSNENELTDYVIEEISSILINKGNLRVVERSRIEILENEHNWQMDTGYVPDNEVTSIVEKLGAQYIVSCYITGSNYLQRLRIKTWNLLTGETLATSIYPVDFTGEQLVQKINENTLAPKDSQNNGLYLTIRENGITVDYIHANVGGINNHYIYFDVYIDGTMDYFNIEYLSQENNDSFQYMLSVWNLRFVNETTEPIRSVSRQTKDSSFNLNTSVIPAITNSLLNILSDFGVDRRNINTITRIITREINNSI